MTNIKYQYDDLMNPVIQALKQLGGSGTNEEINNKVAELIKIPSEQLEVLQGAGRAFVALPRTHPPGDPPNAGGLRARGNRTLRAAGREALAAALLRPPGCVACAGSRLGDRRPAGEARRVDHRCEE